MLGWLLIGFSLLAVAAQKQDQAPVIRVETQVVLVDLVATDRNGRPVKDLRRDEVEVFEDGKKQPVAFFQLIDAAGLNAPPSEAGEVGDSEAPQPLAEPFPNRPTPFLFILDLNSMNHAGLEHSKRSIRDFLNSEWLGRESLLLGVLERGFTIRRSFSPDAEGLLKALDEVRMARGVIGYAKLIKDISTAYRILGCNGCDPLMEALIRSQDFLREVRARQKVATESLGKLADYVSSLPGRKNLILYSSGYPSQPASKALDLVDTFSRLHPASRGKMMAKARSLRGILSARLGGSAGHDSLGPIRRAVQRINAAQGTVYSIDPRGLVAETLNTSINLGSASGSPAAVTQIMRLVSRFNSEDISAPQEFLKTLSNRTGGLAFLNRNDLLRGVEQAFTDARSYYLVGYTPAAKKRSKKGLTNIRVKVTRPGVKVRHRRGYFQRSQESPQEVQLNNAFKFPGLFQDFSVRIELSSWEGRLKVRAHIPASQLRFREDGDGRHQLTLVVYGALIDSQGKWVDGKLAFARKFPLSLDASELEGLRRRPAVTTEAEARLPDGQHHLIVVVRQSVGSLLSASRHILP
ncbi:MAG: VWA domain-containing protein [Acidobacteriota bacterium]